MIWGQGPLSGHQLQLRMMASFTLGLPGRFKGSVLGTETQKRGAVAGVGKLQDFLGPGLPHPSPTHRTGRRHSSIF